MKTKPICPHCKADLKSRDGAWWICRCGYKGCYPDRVDVEENEVETK